MDEEPPIPKRVASLLDDGDEDAGCTPEEIERAWEEEIRRRLDDIRSGRVETIPADEVFASVRRLLA